MLVKKQVSFSLNVNNENNVIIFLSLDFSNEAMIIILFFTKLKMSLK